MQAFETWTFCGLHYLAVPNGNGKVIVISEDGYSFGAWFSVESFRLAQKEQKETCTALCKAKLSVMNV